MDPIREAFYKIKQDIELLNQEVYSIKKEVSQNQEQFNTILEELNTIKLHQIASNNASTDRQTDTSTHVSTDNSQTISPRDSAQFSTEPSSGNFNSDLPTNGSNDLNNIPNMTQNKLQNPNILPNTTNSTHNSTDNTENTTNTATSTHNSTHPVEIEGSKYPNFDISSGNEGVSTDRQTDTSTDRQTHSTRKNVEKSFHEASEILDSLDNIKKEIRLQFKSITQQELLVFSTIYQFEGEEGIDYSLIASKLKLSQSSIRDYVQRLINKGIPVVKSKLNNKKIVLQISPELRKLASLDTIIKLREL